MKLFHKVSHKKGLAPGALVYVGAKKELPAKIVVIDYDGDNYEEHEISDLRECLPYKEKPSMTWINIFGIHEINIIEEAGKLFEIHPLVLEDIVNAAQRPKTESTDDYLFTVVKMLHIDTDSGDIMAEQVSIITFKNLVITFQEFEGDVFELVRKRIRSAKRVRMLKSDYLTYALLDAVVDNYFVILENMGERIEVLEDELLNTPDESTLQQMHQLKRDTLFIRKLIWPLRETISSLTRGDEAIFSEDTIVYLRDVYEHIIEVVETLDNYRDMLTSMIDLYISTISNKMNEVMKVLTIIATIFIPLTFIAGIYGMNFQNMPELSWKYGYFALLGVMAVVAILMIIFFIRKRWF